MLIGTAVCGKPHVRWCERAGEIKTSPLYSICLRALANPARRDKIRMDDLVQNWMIRFSRPHLLSSSKSDRPRLAKVDRPRQFDKEVPYGAFFSV